MVCVSGPKLPYVRERRTGFAARNRSRRSHVVSKAVESQHSTLYASVAYVAYVPGSGHEAEHFGTV